MYYYDVALAAEKHWDEAKFTYGSEEEVAIGALVNAPFGPKRKVGFVTKKTSKPSFTVKPLIPYEGIIVGGEMQAFITWYRRYYVAKPGQVYTQVFPNYLPKKLPKLPAPKPPAKIEVPKLNGDQNEAKQQLMATPKPSILHGITGSGKTRLYLSLILDSINAGKTALLLYPEISLTSQLLQEIEAHATVVAFHSGMTDTARSKRWFQVATSDQPLVVIGPRSSLFLPFHDLGLIIIDEAHESTYKQENDIHYNGLLVAGGLAKAHGAKLIMGSATPPITETELVLGGDKSRLVCMHDKAITNDHDKSVTVIDRKDRKKYKKRPLIADRLLASIEASLAKKKQSLLFINRRGTAKLMLCEHCGWQAECESCELPMTYHHDLHKLLCHTCGNTGRVESMCPKCDHKTSLKALGSKAIVDEVERLFPGANVARFDTDTAKNESFQATYDAVKAGSIDILIGTQQIAKGLDLPLLETVGVLDADLSLHFPDFSSDERTFQLLAQVSGRVGRGHGSGKIFIQTLHPENEVIELATREDWHAFRDRELTHRKTHGFPPFVYVAKVIFRDKSFAKAMERAETCKQTLTSKIADPSALQPSNPPTTIDGPLPAFLQKKGGHYYVHLHLRSPSRATLLKAAQSIGDDVILDLDPTTML